MTIGTLENALGVLAKDNTPKRSKITKYWPILPRMAANSHHELFPTGTELESELGYIISDPQRPYEKYSDDSAIVWFSHTGGARRPPPIDLPSFQELRTSSATPDYYSFSICTEGYALRATILQLSRPPQPAGFWNVTVWIWSTVEIGHPRARLSCGPNRPEILKAGGKLTT